MRPLGENIVVRRIEEKSVTESGLHMVHKTKDKHQRGVVLEVGEGKRIADGTKIAPDVKPGDEVLFPFYHAEAPPELEKDIVVLKEKDIIAVFEREKENESK